MSCQPPPVKKSKNAVPAAAREKGQKCRAGRCPGKRAKMPCRQPLVKKGKNAVPAAAREFFLNINKSVNDRLSETLRQIKSF